MKAIKGPYQPNNTHMLRFMKECGVYSKWNKYVTHDVDGYYGAGKVSGDTLDGLLGNSNFTDFLKENPVFPILFSRLMSSELFRLFMYTVFPQTILNNSKMFYRHDLYWKERVNIMAIFRKLCGAAPLTDDIVKKLNEMIKKSI